MIILALVAIITILLIYEHETSYGKFRHRYVDAGKTGERVHQNPAEEIKPVTAGQGKDCGRDALLSEQQAGDDREGEA